MGEIQTVSFSVHGDFITNIARLWYFDEDKPYSKCEELLLQCLAGTTLTEKELKAIARDIMIGKKKLSGNTRDGTYGLQDDNEFDIFTKIDQLKKNCKKRSSDYEEYEDDEDDEGDSSMLDTFIKNVRNEDKFGCSYGWIKPNGEFVERDWNHYDHALEVIKENGLQKEFDEYMERDIVRNVCPLDFLVYIKRWVLLHSPSRGLARPQFNQEMGMTSSQKHFLVDYYCLRGEKDEANRYLT